MFLDVDGKQVGMEMTECRLSVDLDICQSFIYRIFCFSFCLLLDAYK